MLFDNQCVKKKPRACLCIAVRCQYVFPLYIYIYKYPRMEDMHPRFPLTQTTYF